MPISRTYQGDLFCPHCGSHVDAQVWAIVDVEERPDLWRRCQLGTIHAFECPNREGFTAEQPLLVVRRSDRRVIFSPPARVAPDDPSVAGARHMLTHWLAIALTGPDRGEHVRSPEDVPRERLRHALSQGPHPRLTAGAAEAATDHPDPAPASGPVDADELYAILGRMDPATATPDTIPSRIRLCRETLARLSRDEYPMAWALLKHKLGVYLGRATAGNREEHLEEAIGVLSEAAAAYDAVRARDSQADAQAALAAAYVDRKRGDRAANLRSAAEALMAALSVYTMDTHGTVWASCQRRLASCLLKLPKDTHGRRNVDLAIAALKQAARVFTKDQFPTEWADIQVQMAHAYQARPTADDEEKAKNRDRALAAFEAAQSATAPDTADWAGIENDIGTLYFIRKRGEPGRNLSEAAGCFARARRAFHGLGDTAAVANADFNLGQALAEMADYMEDPEEMLRLALQAFSSALGFYSEADYPEDFAFIHSSLGRIHEQLAESGHAESTARASAHYEQALRVYTPAEFPDEHARTRGRLADLNRKG